MACAYKYNLNERMVYGPLNNVILDITSGAIEDSFHIHKYDSYAHIIVTRCEALPRAVIAFQLFSC